MRPKRMSPEVERRIDVEALQRARGDHIDVRTRTKVIATETGFSRGYIANLISERRREHEKKVHVLRETQGNVNSEASATRAR